MQDQHATPLVHGEEVTPEQHEAFWAYIDDAPRAPWGSPGAYEGWAQKTVDKCKVDDLRGRIEGKGLDLKAEDGQAPLSRRAMLDALVHAGAASNPGADEERTQRQAQ